MSELLSLSRLARRLGVTQDWLREQADAGNVPCLKAGKRYLFNVEAVQETLAHQAARMRQEPINETPELLTTGRRLALRPKETAKAFGLLQKRLGSQAKGEKPDEPQ